MYITPLSHYSKSQVQRINDFHLPATPSIILSETFFYSTSGDVRFQTPVSHLYSSSFTACLFKKYKSPASTKQWFASRWLLFLCASLTGHKHHKIFMCIEESFNDLTNLLHSDNGIVTGKIPAQHFPIITFTGEIKKIDMLIKIKKIINLHKNYL